MAAKKLTGGVDNNTNRVTTYPTKVATKTTTTQPAKKTTTTQPAKKTTTTAAGKTTTTAAKKTATPAYKNYTTLDGLSTSTQKNLYKYGQGYKESDAVKKAKKYLDSVLKQKPGEFKSQYDDTISDLYNRILNREDFSYDPNKDPMYQIYKNNYMQQGQQAMTDTVGNAAALTGGYGNSWATTAGSQAYQEYLKELNNAIPELEQSAYARYAQEGENMRSNLQMTQGLRDTEYGQYRDKVADWQADRSYAQGAYDSAYDKDYNQWSTMLSYYSNLAGQENSNYHTKVSEKLAQDQFNFQKQQYADQLAAQKKKSGGGGGGGRSSGSGKSGSGLNGTAKVGTPVTQNTGGFQQRLTGRDKAGNEYESWDGTYYTDIKTGAKYKVDKNGNMTYVSGGVKAIDDRALGTAANAALNNLPTTSKDAIGNVLNNVANDLNSGAKTSGSTGSGTKATNKNNYVNNVWDAVKKGLGLS